MSLKKNFLIPLQHRALLPLDSTAESSTDALLNIKSVEVALKHPFIFTLDLTDQYSMDVINNIKSIEEPFKD